MFLAMESHILKRAEQCFSTALKGSVLSTRVRSHTPNFALIEKCRIELENRDLSETRAINRFHA